MPLKCKLRIGEQITVNGAVIEIERFTGLTTVEVAVLTPDAVVVFPKRTAVPINRAAVRDLLGGNDE